MRIEDFLAGIESDRRLGLRIAAHHVIPALKPRHLHLEMHDVVRSVLAMRGIDRLWSHQAEAIRLIRQGGHVVVMTPTASGKSLIYNLPVIESILEDPGTKALYMFPLKGLEQDQVRNLNELFSDAGITSARPRGSRTIMNPAEVYDGDTPSYRRGKIRERLPHVLFTNPDMLHLAINPFHRKWEGLFRNLRYVVMDEVHSYRGVFGSHVAQVLRRLRRICHYWGSQPQFIACSATIENPRELAEALTGLNFTAVLENGAPQSGKHFIFLNPDDSPYTEATRLFIECLKGGLKTIVFTKARKITELIYRWTIDAVPELAEKISPYRAGFLPHERREIEHRLFTGELLGVVSTSALELGVDIGGLDACILAGYPGSVASTWQRAGRVGRHGQESLIILIALHDALDQYFMRHPDAFFSKSHESAVIDPENIPIMKSHLPCAAAELYLRADDPVYPVGKMLPIVNDLVSSGILSRGRHEEIWFSREKMPQRSFGIRAVGEPFSIVDYSGRQIGELSGSRVAREAFPGAIYLHRGRQYLVHRLDGAGKRVHCKEVDVLYYTQALSKQETDIIEVREKKPLGDLSVYWGILSMTDRVVGYEKKHLFDRSRLSRHDLEMPEYTFRTEGLWIPLKGKTFAALQARGYDLAGSLHAVEHASIACMPLFALCDKGDIGGLSYTVYPQLGEPAIFIYDGYEGGIGLTKRAFDIMDEWLRAALLIIAECPCEDGCPSCVQDPQCGSGNQPLDKGGAGFFLSALLRG